jgi:hypothetical protein
MQVAFDDQHTLVVDMAAQLARALDVDHPLLTDAHRSADAAGPGKTAIAQVHHRQAVDLADAAPLQGDTEDACAGLLKHPLCIGQARQLVLAQLSRHYHRPFADPWDFVRYVHENKLPLDLHTPPQRPGITTKSTP